MLGWLQLLRQTSAPQGTHSQAIDAVERNAWAEAQVVSDLLDLSNAMSGRVTLIRERVDLRDVVRDACADCDSAAAPKRISVRIHAGDPAIVNGDAAKLQQVVWNLVANAIKFTPRPGNVDVRVGTHDSMAEIAITDTGIGIAEDLLPHVFDTFRQGESGLARRFGGLGLGLALVRHLVELHGGSVQALSPGTGAGATFVVRLPLA
jgi:signal transduction histidine kinase